MKLFNSNKIIIQGYVYACKEGSELFAGTKTGDLGVKKDTKSPYIVVTKHEK